MFANWVFFCPAHCRQQLYWAALMQEASTNVIMRIKSSFLGSTVTTFRTYFYFSLVVKSEIKSQEDGGCQNRHVWQHQPSDAAQRCSSRCCQGKRIVCEAGGCIKKSRYCLHCLVFSCTAAGCTTGPALAVSLRTAGNSSIGSWTWCRHVPWRCEEGRVGEAPKADTPSNGTSCLQRVGHIFYTDTNIYIHAAFEKPL